MVFFEAYSTAVILHLLKFTSGQILASSEFKLIGVVLSDVVPRPPRTPMRITYNNNLRVELGNVLSPSQVRFAPTVQWDTEDGVFYSFGMVDPDAPDPKDPKLGEILHWLIVNIPAEQFVEIRRGEVKAEYLGPGPPNGTGYHRYIFLAYKQPTKLKFEEEYIPSRSRAGRMNFKIRNFAEKYNLGHPVAGNVFKSQFDG